MIQITESIRNPNPEGLPLMLPRRIYTFKNGREELIQQHLYDDSNKEIGLYSKRNGREIIYSYGKNSIEAKDAKTKEILWTKTFDDQGNILKFKNAAASYIFQKKEGSYYHIKRISANGVEEKSVSEALFKHFCENL